MARPIPLPWRCLAEALGTFLLVFFGCDLKAEHVAIERQRPFQVGHFQMKVADPDLRMKWMGLHNWLTDWLRQDWKTFAIGLPVTTHRSAVASSPMRPSW